MPGCETPRADDMLETSSASDQKRILTLAITLMIVVSATVLSLTLWTLYQSNFEQRVQELQGLVRAQVALIETHARFDQQNSLDLVSADGKAATLERIVSAYATLGGFGNTGEFVLGHRRGNDIVFLSEFRFPESGARKVVPLTTDRAAPMRRALSNEAGWMIGPDYRGERVVAAFSPIGELDLGLVA